MHYLIKDLNKDEKPREKLQKFGASSLTDVELLALVLRSGGKETSALDLARQIMEKYPALADLVGTDIQQLTQIKFIDVAKASGVNAAIEIGLRISAGKNTEVKTEILKPEDVVCILKKDLYAKTKEHLFLISLNSRNRLIAKDLIGIGTINETLLSTREILRQALSRNAVAVILTHNHPSNDPAPSDEDIVVTKKISLVLTQAGITLLDHIIITDNSFASLKSLGVLNKEKSIKK